MRHFIPLLVIAVAWTLPSCVIVPHTDPRTHNASGGWTRTQSVGIESAGHRIHEQTCDER